MWLKVLQAIIALPQIAHIIEKWVTAIMSYIKHNQKEQARKKAEEARLKSEQATTKKEREDAAKSWFDAISGR